MLQVPNKGLHPKNNVIIQCTIPFLLEIKVEGKIFVFYPFSLSSVLIYDDKSSESRLLLSAVAQLLHDKDCSYVTQSEYIA